MIWTSKPPSKPGWYWRRVRCADCDVTHWCSEGPSLVVRGSQGLSWYHYRDGVTAEEWSDEPIPLPGEPKEEKP